MKLRHQLVQGMAGPPPACCQLPEGYSLEVISDHQACPRCGGGLRRIRTSKQYPVGLMLGRPCVRLIHQQCAVCRHKIPLEVYHQQIPPHGNYAYDLIVHVGLARFQNHQQDKQIQKGLAQGYGLSLAGSSMGELADSFLDGLAAIHQSRAAALGRRLADDGGFAMHVDGTCEVDSDVLFALQAQPRDWILDIAKIPSENAEEIGQQMLGAVERFGVPLAMVRDLSPNIQKAKQQTVPQPRDLICHYHFLENVGKKLCESAHTKLTAALRRLKVRASLQSLRKDMVRWSRKGERLSSLQINRLMSNPAAVSGLDPTALRRFVAYLLLRWLDDYVADLNGEYFPFDLPSLAFYRRGLRLSRMVDELVACEDFSRHQLPTLHTMARHLSGLRQDEDAVCAATRLEQSASLFEELRGVLRLSSNPPQHGPRGLLRGRNLRENRAVIETITQHLSAWRDQLHQRYARESDREKRDDQSTVLGYLEKYHPMLVGHIIWVEGRDEPFVVSRTNNPLEHFFGATKRDLRRKAGTKKLRRQIQGLRPEALLVKNLSDATYVELVLDGTLTTLSADLALAMARCCDEARAIRKSRLETTSNHPIPTTKKQLRNPHLLANVKQTITQIMQTRDSPKIGQTTDRITGISV